ncbi:hypothetical protein [Microcoleus sp. BROC3]|uniref:hypothetical protein n=1 Tax=Microcoleus sp. BROC3 TaxID=3055323 RepID=UPI002FD6A008
MCNAHFTVGRDLPCSKYCGNSIDVHQKAGFWAVFSDSKQDFSQKPGDWAQVRQQQYRTAEPNIGISNQDEIRKSYN